MIGGIELSRRPLAVEVLDGRLVAPGDPVALEAEDRGDAIALRRGVKCKYVYIYYFM
jgi:hypothetical protein